MSIDLAGVACPLATPFRNGTIDADALESHVHRLVDAGVSGLVPCGTVGEFASLTASERETVIATTAEAAPDRTTVVAGAAATNVADAVDRITDAAAAGADAVLLPPPYFHTGSPRGVATFYERVLERTTAPVVLYNFPAVTGTDLSPALVASLAERERVVGLKDSSGDYGTAERLDASTPTSFSVAVGADRLLPPAVATGVADGGVNGMTNVRPEAIVAAYDAARDGDPERARELVAEYVKPVLSVCDEHGYVPTVKAVLAARGAMQPTVRPPLTETPSDAVAGVANSRAP